MRPRHAALGIIAALFKGLGVVAAAATTLAVLDVCAVGLFGSSIDSGIVGAPVLDALARQVDRLSATVSTILSIPSVGGLAAGLVIALAGGVIAICFEGISEATYLLRERLAATGDTIPGPGQPLSEEAAGGGAVEVLGSARMPTT